MESLPRRAAVVSPSNTAQRSGMSHFTSAPTLDGHEVIATVRPFSFAACQIGLALRSFVSQNHYDVPPFSPNFVFE